MISYDQYAPLPHPIFLPGLPSSFPCQPPACSVLGAARSAPAFRRIILPPIILPVIPSSFPCQFSCRLIYLCPHYTYVEDELPAPIAGRTCSPAISQPEFTVS